MSRLLLDELFDNEEDDKLEDRRQEIMSEREAPCSSAGGSRDRLLLMADDIVGQHRRGQLQPAFSTPSLSDSNASTSMLCKSGAENSKYYRLPRLSVGAVTASALRKQSSTGSDCGPGTDSSGTRPPALGYSCTVYYDALEEQLLERGGTCGTMSMATEGGREQGQQPVSRFVLNPVFCPEEDEEHLLDFSSGKGEFEERIGKRQLEEEEEDGDGELMAENATPTSCSREALIKQSTRRRDKQRRLPIAAREQQQQQQTATKKQPCPQSLCTPQPSGRPAASAGSRQSESPSAAGTTAAANYSASKSAGGGIRQKKGRKHRRTSSSGGSEMRLLGGNGQSGKGTGAYGRSTSVAPMTTGIVDGPVDIGSGGKRIQAKQNQMYLITTLLPGTSQHSQHQQQQQQNGGHVRQQSGGGPTAHQQQQHIPVALINRMLPTELILRVFSYLDITSLCRCAQVCRSWNKLAMDGSNWMDVDLFLFQREVKTAVVESLAKRCGNFLKVLSLKGCENVQDNAMRSFATKCPHMERITLAKCKLVTDATCEFIGRFSHKIVMVDLENCTLITDIAMKFIGEGCKRLEELNISWCEHITDLGIAYIAKSCPNLRTLFCKGLDNVTSNCFAQLDMPELRNLSLLSCPNVTDDTVADITRKCHRLEFLSLSNCRDISDQALISIAQGCPRIKDLELAGCTNLSDAGFVQLSKNCHDLERMDMEECLLITDATLSNLNHGCPNLTSLSLSHCENLTDTGLAELCVAHKDRLQVLELDNCPNITDSALESMKVLKVLERVDLYDCQMITKEAIKKFKTIRPEVEVHAYFAPATPPPQTAPVRRGICRCCNIL